MALIEYPVTLGTLLKAGWEITTISSAQHLYVYAVLGEEEATFTVQRIVLTHQDGSVFDGYMQDPDIMSDPELWEDLHDVEEHLRENVGAVIVRTFTV